MTVLSAGTSNVDKELPRANLIKNYQYQIFHAARMQVADLRSCASVTHKLFLVLNCPVCSSIMTSGSLHVLCCMLLNAFFKLAGV